MPSVSVSGLFTTGFGYVDSSRKKRCFDIGIDIKILSLPEISIGANISKDNASAYLSGGYSTDAFSRVMGGLSVTKPVSVSSHAYVVCSNNIGKYSVNKIMKNYVGYKITRYIKGKRIVITNKKKYVLVAIGDRQYKLKKIKLQ